MSDYPTISYYYLTDNRLKPHIEARDYSKNSPASRREDCMTEIKRPDLQSGMKRQVTGELDKPYIAFEHNYGNQKNEHFGYHNDIQITTTRDYNITAYSLYPDSSS